MELNLPKTEQKTIFISEELENEIEQLSKLQHITPKEFIETVVKNHLERLKPLYPKEEKNGPPVTYEEHGTTNERVTLDLPRSIVNFYRFKAHSHGMDMELAASLIAFDVVDKVNSILNGATPEDWKEFFNLKSAFESIALRENLVSKLETT